MNYRPKSLLQPSENTVIKNYDGGGHMTVARHWSRYSFLLFAIFSVVLIPAVQASNQSLQSGTGSVTLPQAAPWTNVSHWRTEVRIHNWSVSGSYQQIFGTNSFSARIDPAGNVLLTSWRDGSDACFLPAPGYGDFIVRMQRDPDNSRLTMELWNVANQTQYADTTCPIASPGIPNDAGAAISVGGTNGSIAYIRTYSSVVALGTAPNNTYNGDLFDYEFEGNGQDSSGRGLEASSPCRGASFSLTTCRLILPPLFLEAIPASRTFIIGKNPVSASMSSGAFSTIDNSSLTTAWQEPGERAPYGRLRRVLDDRHHVLRALRGNVSFTAKWSRTSTAPKKSTSQVKYGGVNIKPNGLIDPGNPAIDSLLGPLIPVGNVRLSLV